MTEVMFDSTTNHSIVSNVFNVLVDPVHKTALIDFFTK